MSSLPESDGHSGGPGRGRSANSERLLLKLLLGRAEGERYDLAAVAGRPASLRSAETDLVDHLWTERAHLLPRLRQWSLATDDVAVVLTARRVRWLQRCNQFLEVTPELRDLIARRYREGCAEVEAALSSASNPRELQRSLAAVFRHHHDTLASLLSCTFGARLRDTPCAQYSPALQLRVLGLTPGGLLEPILDVGCGEDASLPRALATEGLEAYGFDRHGPLGSRGDWLGYEYGVKRWGCVISHLGFSLHFLHEHLRGSDAATRYAQTYMRILASLKPGGEFAYAPSLPFFERLLGPGFGLRRRTWDAQPHRGLQLASATLVRRLT